VRCVDGAIGVGGNRSVVDSLARQSSSRRAMVCECVSDCLCTDQPQVGCDFICEHFLASKPEQMWCISAVAPRHDIASCAGRSTRPAMTCSAAIGKAGADREIRIDIAEAIIHYRALPFFSCELAL